MRCGTRLASAVAALRRYGVADDDRTTCAPRPTCVRKPQLRHRWTADRCSPPTARCRWPGEPIEKLWHAATLLREHRGDGHIAALVTAGVSGRESNVLHCAAGRVPAEFIRRSRDYGDDEWQQCTDSLAGRGLLTSRGCADGCGPRTQGPRRNCDRHRRSDGLGRTHRRRDRNSVPGADADHPPRNRRRRPTGGDPDGPAPRRTRRRQRASRLEVAVPLHPADTAAAVGGGDRHPRPRELRDPAVAGGEPYRGVRDDIGNSAPARRAAASTRW